MSNSQMEVQPISARSEIVFADKRKHPLLRSASQRSVCSAAVVCCSVCKLPLLVDIDTRIALNKSRAESTLGNEQLCQECIQEKSRKGRKTSSRLVRSASVNWSDMSGNIETWFEKARTPDQRVVYNFLQQMNEKTTDKAQTKDLDDVLKNLKKYQNQSNSARPRSKFTRVYESSSWRVLRHPTKLNRTTYGTESDSDSYTGSIFGTTHRKIGSTFLIHPTWI